MQHGCYLAISNNFTNKLIIYYKGKTVYLSVFQNKENFQ